MIVEREHMAQYSALQIAKWFTAWANSNDADLTNMKLQKLLYYAQGRYLAETEKPLFDDEIEAWSHGPVVPSVYHAFKDNGPGDIPPAADFEFSSIDRDTTKFLQKIWNTYGGIATWKLRNMTHNEDPWAKRFADAEKNVVIPKDALRDWFTKTLKK
jgi:uncharacterized phage-associated protein